MDCNISLFDVGVDETMHNTSLEGLYDTTPVHWYPSLRQLWDACLRKWCQLNEAPVDFGWQAWLVLPRKRLARILVGVFFDVVDSIAILVTLKRDSTIWGINVFMTDTLGGLSAVCVLGQFVGVPFVDVFSILIYNAAYVTPYLHCRVCGVA